MITKIKSGQFSVDEYVCDYASEVAQLPTTSSAGSDALCIENKKVYIFNGEGSWVEI